MPTAQPAAGGRKPRRTIPPSGAARAAAERTASLERMTPRARRLYDRVASRYEPPPVMRLSEWAEAGNPPNILLPEGQSARAGNRWRNWPYMVEPIDAIGDPEVERVSIVKGTRVGYTKSIMVAIAASAATDPCPIILLVPTDKDANGYAVDELEPLFENSPGLAGLLRKGRNDGRNTLTRKALMGGGSIKILSALSPRNLRRHDAKKLFCDEVDGMEITKEGDPILLAERRTWAHPDRKIVLGSTPTEEDVSIIQKNYDESDKRIYETPCPHCGTFFEILWPHIRWPEGEPEKAVCICPHCEEAHHKGAPPPKPITERHKSEMVHNGKWRATAPWVKGHRGYKISALFSLIANAAWPKLAAEFVKARKAGASDQQVFANTVEARVWSNALTRMDATGLMAKMEPFGLDKLPPWVVAITAGVDTQDDRLEVVLLGWPMFGAPAVLGHLVVPGSTLDVNTWKELDALLKTRWPHPDGYWLGVDAAAVDSGGSEGRTQKVYDFCDPRAYRNVFAIKGDEGPRPIWKKAAKVKGGSRLAIIGVDQLKAEISQRLGQPIFSADGTLNAMSLRLSEDLDEEYCEQVTNEVLRVKYKGLRAYKKWEPKQRGKRVEALDCTVYAWAVRHSPGFRRIPLAQRAAQARKPGEPAAAPPLAEAVRPVGVARAAPAAPATPPEGTGAATDWAALFNG